MNDKQIAPKRSRVVTIGAAVLAIIFAIFSVSAWFVNFDGDIPAEFVVRFILCGIFAYTAYVLARTARRGYSTVSLRRLARDLFSGGL